MTAAAATAAAVLGRTGLRVHRFGLGTIPLARLPEAEAVAVIVHALRAGVDFVDTARAYDPAEAYVGKALRECPDRRVVLSTKSMSRDTLGLRRDLDESLRQLGRPYVDFFFLHQVDSTPDLDAVLAPGGAFQAALGARDEGLVRFLGVSGHSTAVLRQAVERLPLDLLLGRFNLTMTDDERRLLSDARARGVATATMKVFEGGFVTRHTDLVLRQAVQERAVDLVLLGCDSKEQVDQNLTAFQAAEPLTESEQTRLRGDAEELGRAQFCSSCGYCLATCPLHLPVFHIFNLESKLGVLGEEYGFAGSPGAAMYVADILGAIDACTGCGACEPHCPNRLPIRKLLKERRRRFDAVAGQGSR